MPVHHEIEETIDEYLSKVSVDDKQPLFQSVNKAGTALSRRGLNRHNAWAAIRKRARNAGFLTVGLLLVVPYGFAQITLFFIPLRGSRM